MISARLRRRLLRHHFPLALVTSASGVLLYITRPYSDVITRLSFASAYPALILLSATLAIGPWNVVMKKRHPASLDLRRDIGVWAGVAGVFHVVVGQFVHLRGRPWLYYIYEDWQQKHWQPFRHDLFGLANYTGLMASLILLVLLATSNDASLRKLGTASWKRLQQWNYFCFGLSAVHTFTYQVGVGSQTTPFLGMAIGAVALTITLQYAGYRARRA